MRQVTIYWNDSPIEAREGEPLAAALWRAGHRQLWCGIGQCMSCVVTVDGTAGVRSCLVTVRLGMRVSHEEVILHAE